MKQSTAAKRSTLCSLSLLVLTMAPYSVFAETPEQLRQRLELYRQQEAEAAKRAADRAAADAERRRQTQERVLSDRAETYARTWKRYGNWEINFLNWRQLSNGSWVTNAQLVPVTPDRVWVKVRQSISVKSLSTYLHLSENKLAKLNNVTIGHVFLQGDWVAIPIQQSLQLKYIMALDASELRHSPSLDKLAPLESQGVVRLGDTLLKLSERYGLTLQELLHLNPGFTNTRLVAGTPVQLVQATPSRSRMGISRKHSTSLSTTGHTVSPSASNNSATQPEISSQVAVNCGSLTVNTRLPDKEWSSWTRPKAGDAFEQLLIDRCTHTK